MAKNKSQMESILGMDKQAFDDFVALARDSGVPQEQLINMLNGGYVPLHWQLKFHAAAREADKTDGPTDIGVGGARGPGKSHSVFAQVCIDDCQRVPDLKFLFLRQTGTAAKESFEDLIMKVLSRRIKFEHTSGVLKFPNGSRVILGGYHDVSDIDKYIGIEYDGIAIEELNQLTKDKIDKLKGSLRTSKTNWRPRVYTSFNPGGIGHQDVKTQYIEPFREHTEHRTRFIPSTYKDNPYLNIEYLEYLEALGGNLGRAWREGDWDLFEGQFFSEWRHGKHVVYPYEIPENWKKVRSIDPSGKKGITSCHWYALDESGNVHVYREYYGTGLDSDEHAKNIAELSVDEEYPYSCIDAAAFSQLGLPETMSEVYERCGVTGLVPSSKKRVMGWDLVRQYMRWQKIDMLTGKVIEEFTPKLRVFDTCPNLIRTITTLIHDEHKPEDLDTDGEDHAADDLRYFLQTLREQKSAPKENVVQKRIRELKEREYEYSYIYKKS